MVSARLPRRLHCPPFQLPDSDCLHQPHPPVHDQVKRQEGRYMAGTHSPQPPPWRACLSQITRVAADNLADGLGPDQSLRLQVPVRGGS